MPILILSRESVSAFFLPSAALLARPFILYFWSAFLPHRLPPIEWNNESRLEAVCLTLVMLVVNLFGALILFLSAGGLLA